MDHQADFHTRRRWAARVRGLENPEAAVYGIVISSAVIAVDAGLNVRTVATVESVAGALIIYWLAEAYAHLVTAPPHRRRHPERGCSTLVRRSRIRLR